MQLIDRVAYRLKLRDLRLLDTVVQRGSMAKAAVQLNLSQPAVSKAIAEMEQLFGVRLIDRDRHGVEPTPHGRALLKSAVAIFDQLRHGVMEIEFLSDPTVGEVRIATSEPDAAGLVPNLIANTSATSISFWGRSSSLLPRKASRPSRCSGIVPSSWQECITR